MKSKNYFLTGLFVCLCAAFASGQELRGYRVGRYEGNAANAKGKVVIEIKSIDSATGAVNAHFTASEGLTGEGDLTGRIDQAGVLRLSGAFGDWKMTVAGKVKANEIKANYRMTGQSMQTGNFTAMLMLETAASADEDELAPPDEDVEKAQTPMTAPTANAPPMPNAPSAANPTPVNQSNANGSRREDDDDEESKFAKPDFSAMERWYEIQAFNYDVFQNTLVVMMKAKVESRPTSFQMEYLDADGVVVGTGYISSYSLFYEITLDKSGKVAIRIPGESVMEKVKTVRAVRLKQ